MKKSGTIFYCMVRVSVRAAAKLKKMPDRWPSERAKNHLEHAKAEPLGLRTALLRAKEWVL
jgi:hypothetical protein